MSFETHRSTMFAQYIASLMGTSSIAGRPADRTPGRVTFFIFTLLVCVFLFFFPEGKAAAEPKAVSSSDTGPQETMLTREIRYQSHEAGEVVLVWGIDGWNPISEPLRPSGTLLKKSVMNTPMLKTGDIFVATIQVPASSMIDFGFLITKPAAGADVAVWDGNGEQGYHMTVGKRSTIEVVSPVSFSTSGRWNIGDSRSAWFYLGIIGGGTLLLIAVSAGTVSYRRRTKGQHDPSPSYLHRTFRVRTIDIFLLGGSLLTGIVISEFVLRWMAPYGAFGAARELEWMRTNPGKLSRLYTIDKELGFRPNLSGGFYSEYGTRLNEYGMEKRPGVTRLLFLGDSVTFRGTIIEALRGVYGKDGYEYWNAGVESYNTVQEVAFYKAYNYRIRPDHVILTFHPNDFETTPVAFFSERGKFIVYAPNRPLHEISPFWFKHSHLYRLIIGLTTPEHRGEEAILQEIEQSLIALRDQLKDSQIRFTVLVLPLMTAPELWSQSEHERRKYIFRVLKELRIRHVDLLPPMIQASQQGIKLHDPPGDIWHPSVEMAGIFAQYLRERKLLELSPADSQMH
jgi:hypothetical protein